MIGVPEAVMSQFAFDEQSEKLKVTHKYPDLLPVMRSVSVTANLRIHAYIS